MARDCINCAGPGPTLVTLTLDGRTTLDGVRLCHPCLAAFRTTEWIEVEIDE